MKRVQFNRETISKSKELGQGAVLNYSFEISSKGNGSLILIDRLLRLYDSHDDAVYFKGGLLSNKLVDLNSDGFLDLRINGTAIISEEKGNVLEEKSIGAELIYNPSQNYFEIKSKSSEIYISERI